MTPSESSADPSRYAKQARFAPLGEAGQARLARGRVLVVGCGALGSVVAEWLVRAGVGTAGDGLVRVVDRDYLEPSNLHRQSLYTESQTEEGLPKAIAARERLLAISAATRLEALVADVTPRSVRQLADGVDLIVDGTDNFQTRLVLNDLSIATERPWVYGGVIGAEGRVMTILPGESACLACLVPEPPAAGEAATCDTAGVLGPAVGVVASLEALEAMKLLAGARDAVVRGLTVVDLWGGRWRRLDVPRDAECRCCARRDFGWLEGRRGDRAAVLCGRGAVQLSPDEGAPASDLGALRALLAPLGEVTASPFLVRLRLPASEGGHRVTIFADGRAIVTGVESEAQARSVWSRCLGG